MSVIITVILWIIVRLIPAFVNTFGNFSFGIRFVISFGCLFGGWGIAELLSKNKHNSCIRINYLIFLFLEVIGGYNAYSSTYRSAWLVGMEKSSQFISYATSLFFCELLYIGSCFVIARLKRKRPESPAECDDVLHQPETDTSTGRPSEIGEPAKLVAVPQIKAETVIPSELSGETEDFGSKIRFCNICGFKLIEGSLFCSKCGAPVVMQKNVCPRCGNVLTDDSVFCNRCGCKVSEDAEAPLKPSEAVPRKAEAPAARPGVTPPKTEEAYIYDVAASGRMVRVPASQHAQWREMQDKIKNGTLSEQEKKALQDLQAALFKALNERGSAPAPIRIDPRMTTLPDGTMRRINLVTDPAAYRPMEELAREHPFGLDSSAKKRDYNEKKADNAIKLYFVFIAIALILVIIAVINQQQNSSAPSTPAHSAPSVAVTETQSSLKALPLPLNGQIFTGSGAQRESQLTIHSSASDAYYIKLKDVNNITRFAFFVRPNSTVIMDVPEGNFYIYFASGSTWYGKDDLFGPDTVYSKDSTLHDFTEYTYEYTLYPVVNGNFKETIISAEDF